MPSCARCSTHRQRRARSCAVLLSIWVMAFLLPALQVASAASHRDIAGEYICKVGCRVTDAAPSIEIKGSVADCMSELGGIYTGKSLTATSVYCFNMVGTLAADGKTILWSNGNVWERR